MTEIQRQLLKLKPSKYSIHAQCCVLEKTSFGVSLVEFDYRNFFQIDSESYNDALETLNSLLDKYPVKESSPAILLLLGSLYNLIKLNQSKFVKEYPAVFKTVFLALKTPGIKKLLVDYDPNSSDSDVKVDKKVTIKLDHHERIILPKKKERNVLITSALPYCNNIPHLGNIIGCVLSADVYARYCRLRGYNTLYVCGTDEYGTTTEVKALEEGLSCQALCDKYTKLHKDTYDWFDIDFDHFGRTTTKEQTKIAQDIYRRLDENGHVFEDTTDQLYCETHKSFLADRFVEGTCPLCNFDDARGDQCDGCGKLLNATDLINPHCKLDNAVPVIRESNHLFLNLTEQQPTLEKWFKKTCSDGFWTRNSELITASWLKEGLKPRCISRDLKWGTKIPRDGFDDKVFYVWFDAPIGYPSITATYTKDWEKWWKNPDDVKLYQFMGKDNVPFHTVIFPSTLLGTGEKWTLLHHLSTTEYLQYETGKFSKSRGVGVFGNNVKDSGIPVEVWRYYLLSIRPETSDSQFTWNGFVAANNNELLANLGNFVNRAVKFVHAKYDGVLPSGTIGAPETALIKDVNVLLKSYIETLEAVKIRQGLRIVMEISTLGNRYLQESKLSNSLFADSRERCDTVIHTVINLCYLLSSLVYPYMPSTAAGILRQLNLPQRKITETWTARDILGGHQLGKSEYLFKMIDDSKADECRRLYSGQGPAPKEEKKSKSRSKSKSVEPTIPTTLTPEMQEVKDRLDAQAGEVRRLKTEKADPSLVKEAVSLLLELKKEFNAIIEQK
ncbi:tRNA synthetases class I (M)-domain-containing protein [Globomyces pollinis-pini]|nr:tRNA synthetases class I (M)-domain-containing protein [Globomyces pollinis-pini]